MARVTFSTDLQRCTGGVKHAEVAARSYRELVTELSRQFPGLNDEIIGKYSLAIDGALVAKPFLETFSQDSELVFVARIAAG